MADSKEVVAEGWLEKESKWLCRWNRRWVKLYEDGKLQTFTEKPGEVEAPSTTSFMSFLPGDRARMTLEVDILGAGVMGHSDMCFTFRARPKFCLEILTRTQRVHLGTNDLHDGQSWFSKLSAVALAVSPMNSRDPTPAGTPANQISQTEDSVDELEGAVSPQSSIESVPDGPKETGVQTSHAEDSVDELEGAVSPQSSIESEPDGMQRLKETLHQMSQNEDSVDELEGAVSPQSSAESVPDGPKETGVQTSYAEDLVDELEGAVSPQSSLGLEPDEPQAPKETGGQTSRTEDLVDEMEQLGPAVSPQPSIDSGLDEVQTSEGTVSPQSSMEIREVQEQAVTPPAGQKGKGAPPPKGKGKAKGGPPPPLAPTSPKGKGKGPPPPGGKGKGKQGVPRPGFRVSLSGLKHNVAAFGDLTLRDVQLKEEDWQQLDTLFKRSKEEVDITKRRTARSRDIIIFNPSVHQALGIFMKKKEMQEMQHVQKDNKPLPAQFASQVPHYLRDAVLSLNAGRGYLSQEDLELLLAHIADLKKLEEWVTKNEALVSSDKTNLRELELKLIPTTAVPRYEQRLRVMLIMDTWSETGNIIHVNTQNILNACDDFKTSDALRHLMGVTTLIYNRVMCGAQIQDDPKLRDDTRVDECFDFEAFDIKSFSQLKATKACFNKDDDKSKQPMSMLHFIVGILRKQAPDRTWSKVEGEFKNVELAKNVDVSDLKEVLVRLQGQLGIISRELDEGCADYEQSWPPADGSDDDSESDETCSPERRPPNGLPKSCLAKLHLVKRRIEEEIEKSRREIEEAETVGIELLKYFGHQARSSSKGSSPSNGSKEGPQPGEVKEFFRNWCEFLQRDFKQSWQELDTKFKSFGFTGRTPRTPRTPRSRASTNSDGKC